MVSEERTWGTHGNGPRRARSARGAKGSHRPAVDIRRLRVGADVFVSGNAIEAGAKRCFDQGRDHRQRRHQSHRQRSRHGDAARDRQCRDANQRPADASGLSRRPDGQEGRFSGANRSAPLRDFTGAIRRPTRPRPGIARPGENRSGPLPNAVAAKFDRAADRRGSGLSRQAVRGIGEDRSGPDRRAEAQSDLRAHHLAGRWPRGPASRRSRQLRADLDHQHDRGPHSVAADHRHFSGPRGRVAEHHAQGERGRSIAGRRLRSRQCDETGDRPTADDRQ